MERKGNSPTGNGTTVERNKQLTEAAEKSQESQCKNKAQKKQKRRKDKEKEKLMEQQKSRKKCLRVYSPSPKEIRPACLCSRCKQSNAAFAVALVKSYAPCIAAMSYIRLLLSANAVNSACICKVQNARTKRRQC